MQEKARIEKNAYTKTDATWKAITSEGPRGRTSYGVPGQRILTAKVGWSTIYKFSAEQVLGITATGPLSFNGALDALYPSSEYS